MTPRDDHGRYAPRRETNYPMGRPSHRRFVTGLMSARIADPNVGPRGIAEWWDGVLSGWNPKDGPNPYEKMQLPLPIGDAR